ncbi:hypothetical protein [Thermanaeromonas toyohensis]|uniref:hypothetical protein n=1 Tax=Thermanaeromonas toyohensis TaxID=161154 RepID=UPI000A072546|nr:hypothetical protein [Thermanaeromonas toyohensis]
MNRTSELSEVLARWRATLLQKKNVVAVGYGFKIRGGRSTDIPAILVYVARKVPLKNLPPKERIPPWVEGWPTDVVEAGDIRVYRT